MSFKGEFESFRHEVNEYYQAGALWPLGFMVVGYGILALIIWAIW